MEHAVLSTGDHLSGDRNVTSAAAPPGWYPDPALPGGQRYYDGAQWTEHAVPPPVAVSSPYGAPGGAYAYPPWGGPPWKGAQLGRPAFGPGALADPGRRLGARLLDALVFLPVAAVLIGVSLAVVAPHAGPIFPGVATAPDGRAVTPGILWIELTVFGAFLATGVLFTLYDAIATARYGRTLGKAWMHLRPVRLDGTSLGWGRSFGRAASCWVASWLSWIGLLDPLWCLWDGARQCVHDKVAGTIVVNDA